MEKINPETVLTEEEKKACKESFDAYDKLGYGTLEVEELQKVLEGKRESLRLYFISISGMQLGGEMEGVVSLRFSEEFYCDSFFFFKLHL